MVTLDAHLMALYENGIISYEEVITSAQDVEGIGQKMQQDAKGKKR